MIVCVIRGAGVQRAEWAAKKVLAVALCLGPFAGVVPDSPMAFMKKTFSVPSSPWRDTRHVKHLGSETKSDVLPPRRVESGGPVCVPVGLGGVALVVKYPRLEWNKERCTRIDFTPGPAM